MPTRDAGPMVETEVAAPPGPGALARSMLALLPGLPVALLALVFCLPQGLLLRSVSRTKPATRIVAKGFLTTSKPGITATGPWSIATCGSGWRLERPLKTSPPTSS